MTETAAPPAPLIPDLVENLLAPEVFANEASFFATTRGVVTITFTSDRFDNSVTPPQCRRVVVGRLVMPSGGAQNLAVGLYNWLKQSGLDPIPSATRDKPQ